MNHFAPICLSRLKKESIRQLQTGHAEYSTIESDYDDLNTLELTPKRQTNAATDQQYPQKLFATLVLGKKPVKFQIDSGSTCNIITQGLLDECLGKCELQTTTQVLTMYNRSIETPTGHCTDTVTNPKNNKSYGTEFVVIANHNCPPLLGSPSSQQMELIQVQHENILAVGQTEKEKNTFLKKDTLLQQYPDVFSGTARSMENTIWR